MSDAYTEFIDRLQAKKEALQQGSCPGTYTPDNKKCQTCNDNGCFRSWIET